MSALVLIFVALVLAGTAGFIDYRTGKIPNWLLLLGLGGALVVNLLLPQLSAQKPLDALMMGVIQVLLGAAVCGMVPLLLWRFRAMGAGDVKLLAVLGALLGPRLGAELSMYAFSIASLYVIIALTYRGRLFGVVASSLWAAVNLGRPKDKRRPLPAELLKNLRFAPAIFAAVCVVALGFAI
jgi:prepilin peptidase CpaA